MIQKMMLVSGYDYELTLSFEAEGVQYRTRLFKSLDDNKWQVDYLMAKVIGEGWVDQDKDMFNEQFNQNAYIMKHTDNQKF